MFLTVQSSKLVYVFIQTMNKDLTEPTVTQKPVFNFQNPSEIKPCKAKLWI